MEPASNTDLSLAYQWNAASVPPPYHYEYVIELGPGPHGAVVFLPDYSQHDPPQWRRPFGIESAAWTRLLALLDRQGLFSRRWRRVPSRIVGDSQAWLKAARGGHEASVPSTLSKRDAEAIAPVYQAIKDLVPRGIWDELMEMYHQYQREHQEA